ncbi:hypothetical protein [Hyalangium rubrum]|uniref:Lipoprotein n=1 Tax=Hyalangium rubrum TaxID=3103134 RepID=A0ABU5GW98_9BACT|nr:hypothetical protein [Hyalangium sp. s54d21]MDY7225455.1 hypothetical protein [Hyalangium sp. s54d21]
MKTAILPTLLLLPALIGCGSREEGLRLHLGLAFHAEQGAWGESSSRQFTNDRGEHITLSRAYLTVSSVEIIPCPTLSAWRWLRQLSPVGTAHAHSESHPRRLGTPHVISLERPDGEALALGTLHPPPAAYCRARLVLGPADADAEGEPIQLGMEGKTLRLEGTVVPASGGPAQAFTLESAAVANAEVPLEALSLTQEAPEAHQLLTLAYDRWLDGVSPLDPEAATQAVRNAAASVTMAPSP